MKKFSWKDYGRPIIALAPMDGWTDSAFRQIIKYLEPSTLVFTEFVSVDGIAHHARTERLLAKAIGHKNSEKPLIVQFFGNTPEKFALAAKIVEKLGADGIDINFGCPARKVVHSDHGAALLKNPHLAMEIVKATKSATKLDVSVKTRLGWEDKNQIFDFGEKMLASGADALTIHGRTATQKFTGKADWENIFAFKEKHPDKIVIGNGDIDSAEKAIKVLDKLDGVMIGRAVMQNPWIFSEIFCALENKKFSKPDLKENIKITLQHAKLKEQEKGIKGIMEMRKFFAAIIRGFDGASDIRAKLMQIKNYKETEEICKEILNRLP